MTGDKSKQAMAPNQPQPRLYSERTAVETARDKIKSLDELADISAAARAAGKGVVLAHGVFDLLHLGHVRHLEAARAEGDILMVTISSDKFVNKGPGRPVFPEAQRAEMLASLSIVDHVAVSPEQGAEYVIEQLQPQVYAKGTEYAVAEHDVTGRIVTEQEAVERHGGRVLFTDDITFSSSALLNRYFQIYSPGLQSYLDAIRETDAVDRLIGLIDKIRDCRVLFVGDCIIDEYQYVEPLGKPSKENIIATRHRESEVFSGGVIAAANYLADFCGEIEVVTLLGTDPSHEDLIRSSLKPNVKLTPFYREGAPTTRKLRMVDPTYTRKLFEVAFIDDRPLDPETEGQINSWIANRAKDFDVVAVNDFGHGFIGPSTVEVLCRHAPFLAVNAQTNSANAGYNLITKYPRADYICIDAPEARLAAADKDAELESVISETLASRIDCGKFIVTHGQNGCVAYDRNDGIHRIPAFTRSVVDTMGAGDAFFAITAPMVAQEGSIDDIAFIGNAVGAMKVGFVGHRGTIARSELIKYLVAMLK